VNRILRQLVLTDDVLGLGTPPRAFLQIDIPGRFDFPADIPGKARAFDRFMRLLLDAEVLELAPISGAASGWQNKYVRASYSVGVTHADRSLRAIGVDPPPGVLAQTLNQPIHVEKLQLLFSRNFNELQGITNATAQQLSRIVTEGLATGQSPRTVARAITNTINTLSRNRSLVLARTETIRSHATATLTRFRQSGVETVRGFAEFATARDARVCPDCDALEGKKFTLDEAASIIPVHPNCRCVWLPVL
jgi:SPP1 gp7 family putative phage head morphogenesis protein